jgi:hypothetical protein
LALLLFVLATIILFLYMAFGTAGRAAVDLHLQFRATMLLFSELFCFASAVTLAFGEAFDVRIEAFRLRQYPIATWQRFALPAAALFFTPLWLSVYALTLGWSLSVAHEAWRAAGASSAFVMCTFFFAQCLVLLATRAAASLQISSMMVLTFFGSAGLLIPALTSFRSTIQSFLTVHLASIAMFTPPGAACYLLHASKPCCVPVTVLGAWVIALVGLSALLHSRPGRGEHKDAFAFELPHHTITDPVTHAIASKTLNQFVRIPRLRLVLAAVPLTTALSKSFLSSYGNGWARTAHAMGFVFAISVMNGYVLIFNQFGYDGFAFDRYRIAPGSLKRILHISSLTSLLIPQPLTLVSVCIVLSLQHLLAWPVFIAGTIIAISGSLYAAAIGLWTSVLFPFRLDLNQSSGAQMSSQSAAGIVCLLGTAFVCSNLAARHLIAQTSAQSAAYLILIFLVATIVYAASMKGAAAMLVNLQQPISRKII